jgi:rare lipoprotein A
MISPVLHCLRKNRRGAALAAMAGALAMGGCAQAPSRQQHAKEYFPESSYGAASPRVVADGEDVPKGGGKYLVGKPYSVAGKTYVPSEKKYASVGLASWYGDAFHGRRTANGEIYDKNAISAAHPTMPLPSYARVTNLRNQHSIIVRVNDRGPYHGGRVMDLSARAAEALDYKHLGTAKVKIEYVGRAAISGSDDRKLLATLRVDGQPAQLDGVAFSPVRLAEQREQPSPAPRESERVALAQPESVSAEDQEQAAQATPLPPSRPVDSQAYVPPPESQRVALSDMAGKAAPGLAPLPSNPPLPPQRPFDLGTIPGADTPITVSRR